MSFLIIMFIYNYFIFGWPWPMKINRPGLPGFYIKKKEKKNISLLSFNKSSSIMNFNFFFFSGSILGHTECEGINAR